MPTALVVEVIMDITIRPNKNCIIGLPSCDYVFSSTRSCFIGYGFSESALEMNIIKGILKDFNLEAVEAGESLSAGSYAFCTKICSKIITSQFCIAIVNNDTSDGKEVPNANVNMEYGLMLAFNKYVIPFQRSEQKLPFNVAGLDTIKYTNQNFESKARMAVDKAAAITSQEDRLVSPDPSEVVITFLLSQRALISPIDNQGDKELANLGRPLGFLLLNDFTGSIYRYFGLFTNIKRETVIWRSDLLQELLVSRFGELKTKREKGIIDDVQYQLYTDIVNKIQVWILVNSDEDRDYIKEKVHDFGFPVEVFSFADIENHLEKIGSPHHHQS